MKKHLSLKFHPLYQHLSYRLLLTIIILSYCNVTNAQIWKNVGSAGFSTGGVSSLSMAIDASGVPYVLFMDSLHSGKATVMKYSGAWLPVGSIGFSSGKISGGYGTSIAIDLSGTPYVAFIDESTSYYGTSVMKYNGSSWVLVGSAGFSLTTASYPSMAIDGSGTPYIAYQDGGGNVSVRKFTGTTWTAVGSLGFSAGNAQFISLTLDAAGTPFVAYKDNANGLKATVMKYNGSAWVNVGSAGFSAGIVNWTSIKVDASGTPYVAYQDVANGYKATVMKYTGTAWVTVGSVGFSSGQVNCTSLAINAAGVPFVTYEDDALSGKATCMEYSGSTWTLMGSSGFSAGGTWFNALAIDATGTPFVAYQDYANSNKATVMNLFTVSPISGPSEVCVASTVALTDATSGGTWSSSNTGIATVTSAGIVTGVNAGTATISYTASSISSSLTITVNALPAPITGTANICGYGSTTLTDLTTGGSWSSQNTAVARVSGGVVSAYSPGTSLITYSLPTGCYTTTLITISLYPTSIVGQNTMCVDSTVQLNDASPSGAWSSGQPSIATISATGRVTGIAPGTALISYTLPSTCSSTTMVTVNNCKLSVNEFSTSNHETFEIYPNPVENEVFISAQRSILSIELYDILGQAVIIKSAHSGINQIDVSDLPTGLYILKIDGIFQTKICKR